MKRGQSALEYLVTYGWAILAIVIVAALLWALGIFNPGGLVGTGSRASGFTFNVLDQKYAGTVLTLTLGNTQGKPVSITAVTVTHAGATSGAIAAAVPISTGASQLVNVTGAPACGTTPGVDKYTDATVVITYDIVGGIAGHADSGTISGVCA